MFQRGPALLRRFDCVLTENPGGSGQIGARLVGQLIKAADRSLVLSLVNRRTWLIVSLECLKLVSEFNATRLKRKHE